MARGDRNIVVSKHCSHPVSVVDQTKGTAHKRKTAYRGDQSHLTSFPAESTAQNPKANIPSGPRTDRAASTRSQACKWFGIRNGTALESGFLRLSAIFRSVNWTPVYPWVFGPIVVSVTNICQPGYRDAEEDGGTSVGHRRPPTAPTAVSETPA